MNQILTASGCLPVPSRNFPSEDAGVDGLPNPPPPPPANPPPPPPANPPPPPPPPPPMMDAGVTPDSGGSETPDAGTDPAIALSGVWGLRVVQTDTVESEALQASQSVTLTTIARVEMNMPSLSIQVCSITPSNFQGYTTTYSEQLVGSINPQQSDVTIATPAIGATFAPEPIVINLGWRALGNAATERLPAQAGDLRVRDTDNDNNVGATLEIAGPVDGEMYVAWRNVIQLDGEIQSTDRIAGLVRAEREQNTLDGSNDLLAESNIDITADPDPAQSTFELLRSTATDCNGISRLFP